MESVTGAPARRVLAAPVLWRGSYASACQVLAAVKRRLTYQVSTYRAYRRMVSRRARLASHLMVELESYQLLMSGAPDVSAACRLVYPPSCVVPLRELLGVVGSYQWRLRGVHVPALDARIHPHYGVFAPTRQEYVSLVAAAPVPALDVAFDVGTGTGVLAALLARRGFAQVVATDTSPQAVACARDNVDRLGLSQVSVLATDLFPPGRASLVVCNPPWLPGTPRTLLDSAIYDQGMLRRFLAGLPDHLAPGGEGWLVLSDIAELFGLRTRADLLGMIADAGLQVVDRLDTRPQHRIRGSLAKVRAAEVVSLWRLRP